jgi:hypothetical protein
MAQYANFENKHALNNHLNILHIQVLTIFEGFLLWEKKKRVEVAFVASKEESSVSVRVRSMFCGLQS